jgi:phosphatidylglycerol:prolipoprotein diacylglycerol transferase
MLVYESMLPVLIKLGPITIYSFGVFLFLAFFSGTFVIWKRGREENFDEESLFDMVLISSFWALVGARVAYILLSLERFGADIIAWFNIFGKAGLNSWGALVGGLAGVYWFSRKKKWDFFEITDVVVVGVVWAQVMGWIGSFLNGSGYGLPTNLPIGMNFPGLFDKRHPAQLYAAAADILLFIWLWWVEGKYRIFDWYRGEKTEVKAGFLMSSYLIGSGLIGLMMVGVSPGFVYWLGVDGRLVVSVVMLVFGLVVGYWRSGRELKEDMRRLTRIKIGVGRINGQKLKLRQREVKKRIKLGDDII